MTRLDLIAAHGNRGYQPATPPRANRITCSDGFSLSVIAGPGVYCLPRPALFDAGPTGPGYMYDVPEVYPGPYTHVEVGFPSERPEPWDIWARYVEDADEPTETVYGYVPVEIVAALIASHGGES